MEALIFFCWFSSEPQQNGNNVKIKESAQDECEHAAASVEVEENSKTWDTPMILVIVADWIIVVGRLNEFEFEVSEKLDKVENDEKIKIKINLLSAIMTNFLVAPYSVRCHSTSRNVCLSVCLSVLRPLFQLG